MPSIGVGGEVPAGDWRRRSGRLTCSCSVKKVNSWVSGMSERMVEVWDRLYIVTVEQISESVWEVVGDYMFKPIRVRGESEWAALQRWRETARDKGDWNAPATE
jgi:hypothetical protein